MPKIQANTNTVNSVLGKNINTKNNKPLREYKRVKRYFFDNLSPKYPKYIVPITLNNPIRANAHPPTQKGNCSSSIKAGRCTATNVT